MKRLESRIALFSRPSTYINSDIPMARSRLTRLKAILRVACIRGWKIQLLQLHTNTRSCQLNVMIPVSQMRKEKSALETHNI